MGQQLKDVNETHTIKSWWENIKNIVTKTSEEAIENIRDLIGNPGLIKK